MVSYLAQWDRSNNNTANFVSVTAVTWPIRLAQASLWQGASDSALLVASYRYDGGAASGGSSAPIVPLREGAPAATATARVGALTFTGTQRFLPGGLIPPGVTNQGATSFISGATSQIDYPLTTVITPGSTFVFTSSWLGSMTWVGIYFEELRLSGSY